MRRFLRSWSFVAPARGDMIKNFEQPTTTVVFENDGEQTVRYASAKTEGNISLTQIWQYVTRTRSLPGNTSRVCGKKLVVKLSLQFMNIHRSQRKFFYEYNLTSY